MASGICLGSSWDSGMGRIVVSSDTPASGIIPVSRDSGMGRTVVLNVGWEY